MISASSERNTSSKLRQNFVSRSRRRKGGSHGSDPPVGAGGHSIWSASRATTRAWARPRCSGVARLTAIDSAVLIFRAVPLYAKPDELCCEDLPYVLKAGPAGRQRHGCVTSR